MYKIITEITIVAVEKQLSITYSECVSVTLGIQHKAHAHYYIVICGLAGPTIVFSIIS